MSVETELVETELVETELLETVLMETTSVLSSGNGLSRKYILWKPRKWKLC